MRGKGGNCDAELKSVMLNLSFYEDATPAKVGESKKAIEHLVGEGFLQ